MKDQTGIFVSIASYRDAELLPTLHNMLEKASGLSVLNIAVCWQDEGDISLFQRAGFTLCDRTKVGEHDLFIFECQGHLLQILCVHYFLSEGACWARSLCEKLYRQEDYCLQIDSHCRFIDNWDTEMVSLLQQLKQQSARPVISSYPPGYQPGKEDEKAEYVSRLVLRGFSAEKILQLTSVDFQSDAPVRGVYLAGGFIFAEAHFLQEVPNDPLIFFEGEEIAMAVRAFTHGYDIWHPHKILLWHFYNRENHARVWSDHNSEAEKTGSISCAWWKRDRISKNRVKSLLGIEQQESDLGCWGLGVQRSLEEFEYAAGISFQHGIALPEVMGSDRIAWFSGPPRENWRSRLTTTTNKTVTIAKWELDCDFNELAWLHVGVYSSDNNLLQKKTLSPAEINDALTLAGGEKINVVLDVTTSCLLQPHMVRISPYLHSSGWGKVVERNW